MFVIGVGVGSNQLTRYSQLEIWMSWAVTTMSVFQNSYLMSCKCWSRLGVCLITEISKSFSNIDCWHLEWKWKYFLFEINVVILFENYSVQKQQNFKQSSVLSCDIIRFWLKISKNIILGSGFKTRNQQQNICLNICV